MHPTTRQDLLAQQARCQEIVRQADAAAATAASDFERQTLAAIATMMTASLPAIASQLNGGAA